MFCLQNRCILLLLLRDRDDIGNKNTEKDNIETKRTKVTKLSLVTKGDFIYNNI